MKILVLSHLYPSENNPAFGIFVHHQVKTLMENGHEVTIISPVFWAPKILSFFQKKWENYYSIPKEDLIEGVNVYRPRFLVLPRAWLKYLYGYTYYFSIRKLIYDKLNNFDVIHAHTALPDGFAGLLVKNKCHVPLVTTIHGISVSILARKNRWHRKAVVKVLTESDAIVVVSSVMKKLVYKYSRRENKVFLIGNGVPLKEIKKLKSKKSIKNHEDKKILLSVGFLIKQKGHEYLLKALPHVLRVIPNLLCLFIGDGKEKASLKKLTHSLNLTEHVKFLGYLPNYQTLEYMSMCDVFVLPSWNEGFGIVYIEAMAFGKPVIGCKGEGIEDIVNNRESGILVNAKDVKSLEKALVELLTNEELAQKMGEKGKSIVEANYTWESNVKKLTTIYETIIKDQFAIRD